MRKANLRRPEPKRPRELLRYAEMRAVGIRKRLKKLEPQKGRRARGIMDDAAKLAQTIEHLARWGRTSSAEEAVDVEFRIEVLTSLLEGKVDQILAS